MKGKRKNDINIEGSGEIVCFLDPLKPQLD